ncbi:hypothetical protein RhiJN_24455 [Ceratobasidium sp. AG-Ba]|nr:hypothetical protein RhiJN_24455 [Ceratobasidium sp. AG-Ba]
MADAEPVRVLPASEVEALLTELAALISTLPESLPVVEPVQSKYGRFLGFVPDPELVEERGVVGAVNTALEHAFGDRRDGLKIIKRGKGIDSIVPLLEKFLKRYPGDIILQKWLLDFVSAARELRPKRTIKQTEKARKGDLKRKAPDTSDTSISVTEIEILSDSEHSLDDFNEPTSLAPAAPQPPSTSRKRPTKRVKKTGPSPDAIPDSNDERYSDNKPAPPRNLQGGAPRNLLADRLVISCFLKNEARIDKNHRFRCIASSLCDFALANTKRQMDRLRYAVRCRWLRNWKPELFAEVEVAYARRAAGHGLGGDHQLEGGSNLPGDNEDPPPPGPAATIAAETLEQLKKSAKNFFTRFHDQGKLDHSARINLAIVRLLCAAGVPPSIADPRYWKALFNAINPRLSDHTPPSSTTLRDSLIPAEAHQSVLSARRFLQTQQNLSISFDGLTQGSQPVYTVHVSTADRKSFLLRGDVYYGSHNSACMTKLLVEVACEIGVERIKCVTSDDTNATKKARKDFVAMYPTIINLADPCHKLNLVIQDICSDTMFVDTIRLLKILIKHFSHSTFATSRLKEACASLGISTELKSIGKTRFATVNISAVSVIVCMPGLYRMNNAGELETAPEDVRRITKELTWPAMLFLFGLKKMVSILEPFARPLLCLESSNATIADNHLMWMAGLAMADDVLNAQDSSFEDDEKTRMLKIINNRFNQTINTPPDDVYILASFGDPRMRGMRIYRNSNPLAPSIVLPASRGPLRAANTSPSSYISDSTWTRIRKSAMGLLKNELTLAESSPAHPLSKYVDAQQAKNELDTRLVQYACSTYPFDQPLGQQTVLDYWSDYLSRPDTKVLGFIFTKLYSAMPNSMNDERTGSRMTFLYSKLRSRTDINTMVEQIQVKQWHELIDEYVGNVKRSKKKGPLLKYRNVSLEKISRNREEQIEGSIPVALNDEEGDDWLEPGARPTDNDVSETESPSQSYDHLEFIDLKSAALVDFISDTAQTLGKASVQGSNKNLGNEQIVRKAADVDWD